jgi:glyceraldehyde 3-phosphate dehydrogenase
VININIAINGFGRIGRAFFKAALEKKLNIVAINDLTDTATLAYLLKHDSVYRNYKEKISYTKNSIRLGNKRFKVYAERDPEKLPWKKLKIDVVLESTGFFRDREGASKHLKAGAKKVLISAPAKKPDVTIVLGVNDKKLKKSHKIISMGSCTTNCLAPIVKTLNNKFGIKSGFMTTVHAYTNDQKILDVPHKKLRRGRAAALSIIPTTSGATTAVTEVIPSMKGKLDGLAMRVPVPNGSIVDFVCTLKKKTTKEKINAALKSAAKTKLKGILEYSEEELVGMDIVQNPHSSILDSLSTQVINGNTVKILSWYDNEWGYSNRLVDLIKKLR